MTVVVLDLMRKQKEYSACFVESVTFMPSVIASELIYSPRPKAVWASTNRAFSNNLEFRRMGVQMIKNKPEHEF